MKKTRQIHKTAVAMVFITLMVALPMTMRNVAAFGPSGTCYSKNSYQSDRNKYPWYVECEHTHLNTSNNMMVGLGVYAYYDLNPGTPDFNYGNWWFSNQAGYSFSPYDNSPVHAKYPMECTFCVDYGLGTQYYSYYYQYSGGWANGYYYNGYWKALGYYAQVVNYQAERNLQPHRISVEGVVWGKFYYNVDPNTYYYHAAYTQFPPGKNPPVQSFAFLTAHQSGDW